MAVIDDDAVEVFGQQQGVAKLDLGPGLAPHEDVEVALVETRDFVGAGDGAFAVDALVGLLDGCGELAEDVVDDGQAAAAQTQPDSVDAIRYGSRTRTTGLCLAKEGCRETDQRIAKARDQMRHVFGQGWRSGLRSGLPDGRGDPRVA